MAIEEPIVVRLDGTNAEEGRRLLREAAPRESPRRADDARGGQARGGAGRVTDVWSSRAQAMRESPTHREGPDLDLVVELGEPAEGVDALDVATGGQHVARRLREKGATVVTIDPAPGMQPDVISRAEEIPFADDSFDVVACRIAAHHFDDVSASLREMARVTRDRVVVAGQPLSGRGRARRPRSFAIRATFAATARRSGARFFEDCRDSRSTELAIIEPTIRPRRRGWTRAERDGPRSRERSKS